jgi:hypothetical protein
MYDLLNGFMARTGAASLNTPRLRIMSPLKHLMGVAFAVIITLALMEPASSAGLNLLSTTVFWFLHVLPATMVAWVISGWLFNLRASRNMSPWALLVIAGAVTGLLLAPLSVMLELLFGVSHASDPQSRSLSFLQAGWLDELKDELLDAPLKTAVLWPVMNAFVMWRISGMRDDALGNPRHEIQSPDLPDMSQVQTPSAVIHVPADSIFERHGPRIAAKQSRSRVETSGFLGRLPVQLGRDIVFVEAQEHYLRVVTSRGEHLLLQGLTHAIVELEDHGFDGIQIHRSVWVAWKHVDNVKVQAGTVSVVVSTGACLKIGRRRAKTFLAARRQRLT